MGGNKKKRPGPSYDEGRLRDPDIAKAQDANFKPADLLRLLRKAVQPKAKG
jgi:hypothetical protein